VLLSLLRGVGDTQSDEVDEPRLEMIHALLVIAVILFVLWLLFHAAGALVNLLWLVIIVLVVIWLVGFLRGRSAR
jgi:hypothetical protein